MSIDSYLKLDDSEKRFTKEELIRRLEKRFTVKDIIVGEDGWVLRFTVLPLDLANPDNLEFEFCRQEDERWWHPVPTRSSEGFDLDMEVLTTICIELAMEQDFSEMM